MLRQRLISGGLVGGAFLLAVFYLPPFGGLLVLLSIATMGLLEFYRMVNSAGIPTYRNIGVLCGLALITSTFFNIGPGHASLDRAYKLEHLIMLATLIIVFVRQFPQKLNDKPLQTMGCTLFGIWYVPYMFNFVTRLTYQWNTSDALPCVTQTGGLLVLYVIVVIKFTDIGAYFVGSMFGRHKLLPRISPGKTWEGLAGGIAAAVSASWLFCRLIHFDFIAFKMTPFDATILGLLLAGVSVVGDMFESLVKRASGIKDSGSVLPGMGGILDVIDSILFGAPVFYAYVSLFLKP
jgi:phosphatidate cytidylyltransferase